MSMGGECIWGQFSVACCRLKVVHERNQQFACIALVHVIGWVAGKRVGEEGKGEFAFSTSARGFGAISLNRGRKNLLMDLAMRSRLDTCKVFGKQQEKVKEYYSPCDMHEHAHPGMGTIGALLEGLRWPWRQASSSC